jgi:hypothetical protein
MSKMMNQPMARYKNKDMNSNLPVKNNFFKVPTKANTNTAKKIFMPEESYRVMRHTGAYEPKMR